MKDINGIFIEIGHTVEVPNPNDTDIHAQVFTGIVHAFHGQYITVIDGNEDCFDIEPERLTIVDAD